MRIEGIVSSGLGRAHIFMSQHHYQEQFKAIIGRSAWGTLNVHVEGASLIEYKKLRVSAGLEEGRESGVVSHRIKGFDRDGVSFGGGTAFLGQFKFNDHTHDCAILIPDLTRHEDVVEVIAGIFLGNPVHSAMETQLVSSLNEIKLSNDNLFLLLPTQILPAKACMVWLWDYWLFGIYVRYSFPRNRPQD